VPVGLIFFEGAPRLVRLGVTIPALRSGDWERIVVEAYPGVLARQLIGRAGYKTDNIRKQFSISTFVDCARVE
jgi:capsular polysaccharide biosynthesis protein